MQTSTGATETALIDAFLLCTHHTGIKTIVKESIDLIGENFMIAALTCGTIPFHQPKETLKPEMFFSRSASSLRSARPCLVYPHNT